MAIYSGFTHKKWWFSIVFLYSLPEGSCCKRGPHLASTSHIPMNAPRFWMAFPWIIPLYSYQWKLYNGIGYHTSAINPTKSRVWLGKSQFSHGFPIWFWHFPWVFSHGFFRWFRGATLKSGASFRHRRPGQSLTVGPHRQAVASLLGRGFFEIYKWCVPSWIWCVLLLSYLLIFIGTDWDLPSGYLT